MLAEHLVIAHRARAGVAEASLLGPDPYLVAPGAGNGGRELAFGHLQLLDTPGRRVPFPALERCRAGHEP